MFDDRHDAGRRLAEAVRGRGVHADVVLAIPRGGLPVAHEVASALGVPLDVVIARKVGAPANPEFALGAVASDGSRWVNDDAVRSLGVTEADLEDRFERARAAAEEKAAAYRGDRPGVPLDGTDVLLVDDGIATGATVLACIEVLRNAGVRGITVAVPVAPADALEAVRERADGVVCLRTPTYFGAVGRHYRSFEQVSDERARSYLEG